MILIDPLSLPLSTRSGTAASERRTCPLLESAEMLLDERASPLICPLSLCRSSAPLESLTVTLPLSERSFSAVSNPEAVTLPLSSCTVTATPRGTLI